MLYGQTEKREAIFFEVFPRNVFDCPHVKVFVSVLDCAHVNVCVSAAVFSQESPSRAEASSGASGGFFGSHGQEGLAGTFPQP